MLVPNEKRITDPMWMAVTGGVMIALLVVAGLVFAFEWSFA